MPHLWNANTDSQYVLSAYAAVSYCTSYMTKVDRSMTNAFKRIRKQHEKSKIDAIQMIRSLGNDLLNLQQISAQEAIHIAVSLPLNHSSTECNFINTTQIDKCTFILKPTTFLKQIPDNSEDVMCSSMIDVLLEWLSDLDLSAIHIFGPPSSPKNLEALKIRKFKREYHMTKEINSE